MGKDQSPWRAGSARVLRNLFRPGAVRAEVRWVVYDHPSRHPLVYPDLFVAQRWNGSTPTNDFLTGGTHRELCVKLPPGLGRRERIPSDDPDVLEVWSLQEPDPAARPSQKRS